MVKVGKVRLLALSEENYTLVPLSTMNRFIYWILGNISWPTAGHVEVY